MYFKALLLNFAFRILARRRSVVKAENLSVVKAEDSDIDILYTCNQCKNFSPSKWGHLVTKTFKTRLFYC